MEQHSNAIHIQNRNNTINASYNRMPARAYFNSPSEQVICLDGLWQFKYFDSPARIPRTIEDWQTAEVPSSWQMQGYDQMHYTDLYYQFPIMPPKVPAENPTGVYERQIELTAHQLGQNFVHYLRFDGVDSAFDVYLNGHHLGYSQGARYTSEFDATPYLMPLRNTLRVVVYKWSAGTYLEDQDMWWLSGIFRSVNWHVVPRRHIFDLQFKSHLSPNFQRAMATAEITLGGFNDQGSDVNSPACGYEARAALSYKGHEVASAIVGFDQGTTRLVIPLEVDFPKLWTSEKHHLYDLDLEIFESSKGKFPSSVYRLHDQVGFRQIQIEGHRLLINGQQVLFKGVNRHDFNCDRGRTVTLDDMMWDLQTMKANNINAVRTAHYPNAPEFYRLCDQVGLYVISEADLECHGFELTHRYDWITDDISWKPAFIERGQRLIARDINRPSIIMWSMGNESSYGQNFEHMAQAMRALDTSRPLHYEGDRNAAISDVYSTMYTRLEALGTIGQNCDLAKPHILCEYAHAMGNGPGDLMAYQELFRNNERLHGGFIWEWIDHGIRANDDKGREFYKYGGDYGDAPHNGNFNCDGIIFPNRTPSPALVQVKKVFEPLWIENIEYQQALGEIHFTLVNDYNHILLDDHSLVFYAQMEGQNYTCHFTVQGLEPRQRVNLVFRRVTSWVTVNTSANSAYSAKSAYSASSSLTKNKVRVLGLKTGVMREPNHLHQLVGDQFTLIAYKADLQTCASIHHVFDSAISPQRKHFTNLKGSQALGEFEVDDAWDALHIKIADYQVTFDKISGQLAHYDYRGHTYMAQGPSPSLWRAPIDNDMYIKRQWQDQFALHLARYYNETFAWQQIDPNQIEIKTEGLLGAPNQAWHYVITSTYRVNSHGMVSCKFGWTLVDPHRALVTQLPRIGSSFTLAQMPAGLAFEGLGPHENYPDNSESAQLNWHLLGLDDLTTPYPYPQENGGRGQVQFIQVPFENVLLEVCFDQPSRFSLRPYTDAALEKSTHLNELASSNYVLNLDYKANGLGSNSCGPEPSIKHQLKPSNYAYGYTLWLTPSN